MSETTEHKVDKSRFPRGEWDHEPDKLNWIDERTGMACMIVRNSMGALCGYVAVERGHPYYEKDYSHVDVECHGGLTYADKCRGHICHVPEPGKPDDVWWFGFDCAHSWDFVPGFDYRSDRIYRDISFVRREATLLARQLHGAAE